MKPAAGECVRARPLRMALGVLLGLAVLVGTIYVLSRTLGNSEPIPVFEGKTVAFWQHELNGPDAAASNAAFTTVSTQVVPQLVHTMLHDTEDSRFRPWLVGLLNELPGVQIEYFDAGARRAIAAGEVGQFGPAARAAVPELIGVVKGKDDRAKTGALLSLGRIHSEPDTVIPLLISRLEDDKLDVPAANALAEFGPLAKAAVPKLLPLLHASDKDDESAARQALLAIDPEAAAKAGVLPPTKAPRPRDTVPDVGSSRSPR